MDFAARIFSRLIASNACVLAVFVGLFLSACFRKPPQEAEESALDRQAKRLVEERAHNDDLIWIREVRALQYEAVLRDWVDDIRRTPTQLDLIRQLPVAEILHARVGWERQVGNQVTSSTFKGTESGEDVQTWSQEQWTAFLTQLQEQGYLVDYFTLNLLKFLPRSGPSEDDQTQLSVEMHVRRPAANADSKPTFLVLRGEVMATWAPSMPGQLPSRITSVDVEEIELLRRAELPAFGEPRLIAVGDPEALEPVRLSPVIVEDLNGDLLPDIVLGGVNLMLLNQGSFQFTQESFLAQAGAVNRAGMIADFNGDTVLDFLGYRLTGEAFIVEGDADGRFGGTPRLAWEAKATYPGALTAGDIDGDGDLDVWATQYHPPYLEGKMPKPFNDANDGFPSLMFRNDGAGHFQDVTEEANFGRFFRRVRSSSLVDLDGDDDLDLVAVSDFAGTEFFVNDGKGHFTNATDSFAPEWRQLGQGHTFGHFNADGVLDMFVAGRWSTAMHRMDAMNLERSDYPEFREKALELASGNHLFLSQPQNDSKVDMLGPWARNTGWPSGVVAIDFDNDTDDDVYVSNGNLTGSSLREFDSEFWRHDVFMVEGVPDEVLRHYCNTPELAVPLTELRVGKLSWGGYEANRLLANFGNAFFEMGYLHGVALAQDTAGTVTCDLNRDGKLDLVALSQQSFLHDGSLAVDQSLVVYENQSEKPGHWIGVVLEPNVRGLVKHACRVRIHSNGLTRERQLVTGESLAMQGPSVAHFGLAFQETVDWVEVRWSNGQRQVIVSPEVDRYHVVRPGLDFSPIPDPPEPDPIMETAVPSSGVIPR